MSSYGTPFIAPADKRFAIVPARLFNRTRYGPSSVCLHYNFLLLSYLTATASIQDKTNVLRVYFSEGATKRVVFIIIDIVIIIIKFDVERHFLIKALTEENITTTAFPASRVAG